MSLLWRLVKNKRRNDAKGLQIIIRAYQPQKRERNLRVDIQNHRLIDRLPTTYIHSKVQSAICFLMSNLEEWSGYDVHAVVQITSSILLSILRVANKE